MTGPVLSVAAALEGRKSVRAFLDRPVPQETVEAMVRQAAWAPSCANIQPWHVHLVDGEAIAALKDLMDIRTVEVPDGEPMPFWFYPDALTEVQTRRRLRNGEILYGALGIDRADTEARRRWNLLNFHFYDAPNAVFLFLDPNATPYQWLDLGIYLQSLLLLIEEAGLSACAQADWAMYGETVKQALGVPQELILVCGVAIGHADPDHAENFIRTERDDPLAATTGPVQ